MGHHKVKRPRKGTMQFWHRKRAKRIFPRIRNWADKKTVALSGFSAYKAGMTHVIAVDNRPKSPTKGEEIRIPVTILDAPNIKIAGLRFYVKDSYGSHAFSDILSDDLDALLSKRIKLPKKKLANQKLQEIESKFDQISDVRVLINTQPAKTTIGKKKPELMEIAIGGEDAKTKFEYAKSILGKEVAVSDVFKDGELIDVHAVTKGKGRQGVVKRFGVKKRHHKSKRGRRRVGSLGPLGPAKTPWWTPQGGQMGFHTRTEYNKQIVKIGTDAATVNPVSGLVRYGIVKNNFILVKGSIAGAKKRLIRLTPAMRSPKGAHTETPSVIEISRRAQQ